MLGGRFLRPEVRDWVLEYLKNGWPTPTEAHFDLWQMISIVEDSKKDVKWTQMAIDNMLKISDIIETERTS